MNWRLVCLALVALGLAPGTWVRSELPAPDLRDRLILRPLVLEPQRLGKLELLGGWVLTSDNTHFGSYSALIALPGDVLLAGSDRGRLLRFGTPGSDNDTVRFGWFEGTNESTKDEVDLESLTRDPADGTIWAGYESSNAIARIGPGLAEQARIRPDTMRDWSGNSGPESLVRLADGRFLVIAEGSPVKNDTTAPALLFADDPLEGGAPLEFAFAPPEGFRPVDAAQLPGGRVLVLVRRVALGLPPRFEAQIVLADPADIEPGTIWRGKVIARLAHPIPTDNFEGLAVVPRSDGGAFLWVISDDNNGALQRTLLLKLAVPPQL